MSVFISGQISEVKKREIKEILQKFNEDFQITQNDDPNNILRVISDIEMGFSQKIPVPTITYNSLNCFVELDLNPFSLKRGEKIKNLHLYKKSVSFTGIVTPLLSRLTRMVLQMGGVIAYNKIRSDYAIIDPSNAFANGGKYIKYQWIQALYESFHFVDPSDYAYSDGSSTVSPSQKDSPRSQIVLPLSPSSGNLHFSEAKTGSQVFKLSQVTPERPNSQRNILTSPRPNYEIQRSQLNQSKACLSIIATPSPKSQESDREETNSSQILSTPLRHAIQKPRIQKQDDDKDDISSSNSETEESHQDIDNNNDDNRERERLKMNIVKDIDDIQLFAKEKIFVLPHRRENMSRNDNDSMSKPIEMDSLIQFTQLPVSDDEQQETEIDYEGPSLKDTVYTYSQDPLMKLLNPNNGL